MSEKIVIAHRGASGYLPEHTLAAKILAYGMGADYLEQDLVMTKDDHLIVLHDYYLDDVTDVAKVFANRQRQDGHYYVIDFTLAEIKQLRVNERINQHGDKQQNTHFSQHLSLRQNSVFQVNTFAEEIELIQTLNQTTDQNIGIYPEIKEPQFHRSEGKCISRATLTILKQYGYICKKDRVYLQCFDANELMSIHDELFDEFNMSVKLVQLMEDTTTLPNSPKQVGGALLYSLATMQTIARYADAIGPSLSMVVADESTPKKLVITDLVNNAHQLGLSVHSYTFRCQRENMPHYAVDFDDLLAIFYHQAGVDGVFTDFSDKVAKFLQTNKGTGFKHKQ